MRQRKLWCVWLSFSVGFLVCLGLHISITQQAIAMEQHHVQSSQFYKEGSEETGEQAIARYSAGQYREAIALWTEALTQTLDKKDIAALHTDLGAAYRQIGDLGQAIAQWEQGAKIYQSMAGEEPRRLQAQVLTEESQAYSALGQFRVAVPPLQKAVELARSDQDQSTEAAVQGALGNAYAASGDLEQAIAAYETSLKLSASLKEPSLTATSSNNLGNVLNHRYKRYSSQANSARAEGDDREEDRLWHLAQQDATAAQAAYEQSTRESRTLGGILQAKALLNLAHFLQRLPSPQQDAIDNYRSQAMAILEKAPNSRAKAYALINLALSYELRTPNSELRTPNSALTAAISVTQNIGDRRAESFALGVLGRFYEQAGELRRAMELTQQAQFAAQQVNAADSLYRWQSQAGRIYKAIGQTESAVSSYRQAIATLQSIRSDLATANKDLQFDLRDSVEPVYRELMALLLDESQSKITPVRSTEGTPARDWLPKPKTQNRTGASGFRTVAVERTAKLLRR